MASPAEMLSSLLPNTVVGGATGWTLKLGNLLPDPDQLIVFYDTGGLNPNPKWLVDQVNIQAIVRAGPNGYGDGYTKARAVRDSLLGLEPVTVGDDRIDGVTCLGDIGFIGYDDRQRPTFSVNFRAIIEPGSGSNREAL